MGFRFVDRIHAYEPFRSIRGIKNVTRNEGFFYWLPDGRRVLSPAVISEAMAQMAGWLSMVSHDFAVRPVLLADERTEYFDVVEAGDQLDIEVEATQSGPDEEVLVSRGTVKVRDRVICVSDCTRGYHLPLADFADPMVMRKLFANLYKPDLASVSRIPAEALRLPALAGRQTFEGLRLVDGLLEHVPGRMVAGFKNFTTCEPYFEDHFPYKPVVPGVLLMSCLGELAQYLLKPHWHSPIRELAFVPRWTENIRFRKFVEPGDQAVLRVEVVKGDCQRIGDLVTIRATIMANDQRVMIADMGFTLLSATDTIKKRLGSSASPEAQV